MIDSRTKGFTLIELLTVIVIIGILAGMLTAGVHQIINNTRKRQAKAEASELVKAWKSYWMTYQRWPDGVKGARVDMDAEMMRILQGIPDTPSDNPRKLQFMSMANRSSFDDPWGTPYQMMFDAALSQGTEFFETRVYLANKNRYNYER